MMGLNFQLRARARRHTRRHRRRRRRWIRRLSRADAGSRLQECNGSAQVVLYGNSIRLRHARASAQLLLTVLHLTECVVQRRSMHKTHDCNRESERNTIDQPREFQSSWGLSFCALSRLQRER